MEISDPIVIWSILKYAKNRDREQLMLFSGSNQTRIFVTCCSLFFNLLVNRSMLDFVLDSVKRSRRSRHHSNCERGTLLTGRSVNPTLINKTSLRASKRLLQQSSTMIGLNRVYWSEAMRRLTKRCVTKRSEAVSKTKK